MPHHNTISGQPHTRKKHTHALHEIFLGHARWPPWQPALRDSQPTKRSISPTAAGLLRRRQMPVLDACEGSAGLKPLARERAHMSGHAKAISAA